jgi:hypothetical protein
MLFWDEWMGFDWYGFRQFVFGVASICLLVSLVAMTEGHPWWGPYAAILRFFTDRATASLIGLMLLFSALFWYWRFKVV